MRLADKLKPAIEAELAEKREGIHTKLNEIFDIMLNNGASVIASALIVDAIKEGITLLEKTYE